MELCTLKINFAVNPFGKQLPDKIVREKFKQYSGKWDTDLENTGLPDKFSLECVKEYLWRNGNYTIKKVNISFGIWLCIRQCIRHCIRQCVWLYST